MIATGSDDIGQVLAERIGQLITDTAHGSPRSTQKRIGPSEVGEPCERKLTYRMYDWPTPAGPGDPIASVIGTGFHTWMETAFTQRNETNRYLIEQKVTVRQGYTDDATIRGSSDLYDRASGTVWDWKLTGVSSLDTYRRQGPGEQYRIQAHLYGLGQENAGEAPKRIAICFVARYHELRVHVWTEPYDRSIAEQALARLDHIRQQLLNLDPESNPGNWARIPTSPAAKCRFCPWLLPGSTDLAQGCPGAAANAPAGSSLEALIA